MKKICFFVGAFFFSIWTAQALSQKEKNIAIISANTVTGDSTKLQEILDFVLDEKILSINEIKEIFLQLYIYCGFPKCLVGMNTLYETLQKKKILEDGGVEAKQLPFYVDKYKYGENMRAKFFEDQSIYKNIVPDLYTLLTTHLYADVFSRGVLTNEEREIVTVVALNFNGLYQQSPWVLDKIPQHIDLSKEKTRKIVELVSGIKGSIRKNVLFGWGRKTKCEFVKSRDNQGNCYVNTLSDRGIIIKNIIIDAGDDFEWNNGEKIFIITNGKGVYRCSKPKAQRKLKRGVVLHLVGEGRHYISAASNSSLSFLWIYKDEK